MRRIVLPLLAWYREHKRILPWRENTDAYRVWISEIMLQQTRVEAVIEYYVRFLERFPDIRSLAEAEEDELLKYWEGLGYYSRARNLHKAAKLICAEYGGVFPSEFSAIRALPGIGDYTAGAIASIAFEQPMPAVDGNVLRVVSRILADDRCTDDLSVRKDITVRLAEIYPKEQRGDFTQSLMELGATVCLPNGAPKCGVCPLADLCTAHKAGEELRYPVRAEKKQRRIEKKTVFIMTCGDCIAVRKRTEKGVLSGMWELPNLEGHLSEKEAAEHLTEEGITIMQIEPMPAKKHIFTHIEWQMKAYSVGCALPAGEYIWVAFEELEKGIALPTAFRKFLGEPKGKN
ncbi:MAG: A/G-specific adenine glycosylase [Christensenellaceae bacterium]|nr:A/G-specific adenine glycosylase [Christensenellaceae bacterium]